LGISYADDSLKGIDSAHETPGIVAKALSTQPTLDALNQWRNAEIENSFEVVAWYDSVTGNTIFQSFKRWINFG